MLLEAQWYQIVILICSNLTANTVNPFPRCCSLVGYGPL